MDTTARAALGKARADPAKIVDALTYVSQTYNSDGKIRTEYIPRMEIAIIDA